MIIVTINDRHKTFFCIETLFSDGLRKASDQSLLQVYIDVNSVVNQRLNSTEGTVTGNGLMNTMDFSLFDLYGIQQIQQQKDVLK